MISAFKTWLRNLPWQMKWGTRSRRSLKSRGRRGSLPAVIEALESRVLLAAVSWTGNAGTGLWTTAGNWNGNQVPGANDDVTIDVPGSASVLLIGDVTVKSLANSETLTLVSNAIVNTKLTFQSGVNSGGTINLDSPRGDRTTSIVVTQGEFINSTDAHINVIQNGGGGRQITGSLTNYGTITVESGIGLTVNNAVSNFEMADGVVSGAGAVTIVGGTFHFTGGSVTGTLNLVDVASTVAESVTGVSRIDVYGTGSTLGANLSVSTTIRLQTDYTYNTTLTTLDGAENRGTIILDSTRGDRTAKLLIGGSQFVNAATGLIQSVVGAGGGRQIRGKLANRGRIDVVGGAYVDIVGTYVVAGGSISGNGYLINSTIEVTESPTAATIVTMYGSNTLATANLPNVDLHLQTDYTYNTTLTTVDGAANRGTITLDSSRTDRTSKLQVGGTHFVNAGTGVIQAVVGGGGGRQIAGTIQNEGQIAANFNLSIGSAAAHHINRGIIANLGATITFTGSSLDNQYGALIGGYGIVTTTGMTFTNNGILDLTRPSIVDVQVDPGVIRVVYTDDMNSTQVSNPANYSLMASGGDGIFDDSNSVNLSANISSVAWDSASKTATLVLSSPLPTDIYRVTVNAQAIQNTTGTTLFGTAIPIIQGLGNISTLVALDLIAASDSGVSSTDNLTNDTTPTLKITVNKPGTINLDVDANGSIDATIVAPSPGVYSITLAALSDGPHDIGASFQPSIGQSTSTMISLSMDTQAPTLNIGSADMRAPAPRRTLLFNEAINPAIGLGSGLTLTGPDATDVSITEVFGSANEYTVSFNPIATVGTYVLTGGAQIADLAGNEAVAKFHDEFRLLDRTTTFLGPLPYLSRNDSPFDMSELGSSFYLEDFEDRLLNTPNVRADRGGVTRNVFGGSAQVDSVDADNGPIDGSGSSGESYFASPGATGVRFSFEPNSAGAFPIRVGVVWTDGDGPVRFEAYDSNGNSLGELARYSASSTSHAGETDEDRFFGVENEKGISAIKISNSGGGIEVDHLQFGYDVVKPKVTGFTPVGPRIADASTLRVTFSESILLGSLSAEDISLIGPVGQISPISVTAVAGSDNRVFDVALPTQSLEGEYTVTIGPAITDLAGNPLAKATSFSITIDKTGPRALSATPTGLLTITPDHVDVTFNEALGRFVAGDVSLVGPNGAVAVGNPALVSGTTYRIPFARQAASGGYTLTVGPGVLDLAGNALDQDADGVPGEAVQDSFTTTFSLALADLVPQNLAAPAAAVAGQSISVSWTTTNLGSSAGATPVKEQIYLSSDALIGNDRFLGEFTFSDVGAHQATIVLPTFGQGSGGLVYLVVVTDTGSTIDESNEANNGAVAGSAINIPLALRVTLPASQVREDAAGALRGVVMRNGDTTNALTVTLASGDSSELTVPATVTIPAGQSGVEFLATPVSDSMPDGNQSVQISAAAASFAAGTATLTVLDVDRPHLTLTVSNSELLEGTSTLATVTREVVSDQPLLVEFASANTAQVATPALVLIPANQASATFTVSTINNATPESSANVTVTATADGYHNASQDLLVDDDDLPTLTLQLNFASVAEGAGNSAILATVRRDVATDQALTVQVRVSDPSRLDVPTKVVIPAGKTLAVFGLTPIDNTLANGDHLIDIEVAGEYPLTGETIPNGHDTANLRIRDDDGPSLQFTLDRAFVGEGQATAAVGTVTRNTSTASPLVVTLASSDTSEATVPATVTIPAGADSVTFSVSTVADGLVDGTQSVTISVSAAGFSGSSDVLAVSDFDAPDLVVTDVTVPANAFTDTYENVGFTVKNLGRSDASGTLTQRVYLSTDPILGNDTFVGDYSVTVNLQGDAPFNFFSQTVPVRIPNQARDYWIIVTTDAEDVILEGIETNNTRVSAIPIHVHPAYSAVVQTDTETALAGAIVTLYGRAVDAQTNAPVPYVPVNIDLVVRGYQRTIAAITDSAGNYRVKFKPLPGEAGHYTATAHHPGTTAVGVDDQFTLIGLTAEPKNVAVTLISGGATKTGDVTITNLSDLDLTGAAVELVDAPANVQVVATLGNGQAGQHIPGLGSLVLHYELNALDASVAAGTVTFRVNTAEGATLNIPIAVTVETLHSHLVSDTTSLASGMLRGQQRLVEFTVTNDGGAETGPIAVRLPAISWLTAATGATMPTILPGKSAKVVLQLLPPANLSLGEFQGTLVLAAADSQLTVPFTFRSLSESKGDLSIEVVDEFTEYAEGAPRVAGATVRVTDALSGTVVFQGTTGSAGTVVASQLPEGYYSVEISAAKHHATRYTTFVAAGQSDQVSLFLARDLVRYTFQVVPTQIADQTKIVVQTEFEANVPAPVLVADPPVIDFADLVNPGDTKQTELTITNHGLIAALDVHLVISQNRFLKITPLITNFGSLAAKASITIPVLLERVATADETSELSGSDCVLMVELDWAMKYGGGKIGFQLPIPVINTGLDPTLCVREIYAGGGFSGGGGGGGGGSVGGTVEFREVVVSPVCCDPCVNALQKLLRDDVPYADWYTPLLSASDTSNALDFADDVLTSLAALGTDVTYVGPTLNLVAAWTSIRQTCLEGALGGAGTASSGITAIIALIDARVARFEAALDAYRDLFGADAWINASTGTKFNSWIARFTNAIDAASPSGRSVTTAERDGLTHGDLPEGIAAAAVNTMLDRWNRTAAYLANGITTTAQLGPSDNHDFIDRVVLRQLQQAAIAGESQNRADGFANAVDSIRDGMRILAGEINCVQPISACPRIRLQLDQTAIIVRNAFDATLELENSSGETLSGVEVQIVVTDLDGNDVTDRFQIRDGSGTSLVGGLVPAGQTGQGRWTIVPTRDAAPQFATSYKVGAILRYTSEGTRVITQLAPVTIAVLPDPVLQVHYFHQRDVFSDDPFTEAIEPSQPFNLAVMVANVGYGVANNVSIVSAQPKITDNDQGLLVDFKIIDTEVDGQNLSPSLTADFGAIQPGEITAARWLMTSTLQGQFIDYKATFEHVDGLGDKRLSLIDSVDIHEMIHLVTAAGAFDDGKYDYLVNDIPDVNDTPDTLFLSDGRILPVTPAANVSSDSAPVPGDLQVQLTATVGAGWNYFKTPDLGAGIYRLTRVVRSDGFEVPVGDNITGGNAWQTDRTFIERGLRPLNENTLHLLDFGGTGHYTLYYAPNDSVGPTVTSITTPASTVVDPVGSLTVTFSEPLLGGTFSSADLALFRDGNLTNLITSAVSISAISATQYQINGLAALNAVDGHYRLEVRAEGVTDLFGNAGTGVKTLEWTKADAAPTVASLTGPSAGPRNSAVAAVRVAFTRDLQADSLDAADLVLTRNGAVVDLAGTALTFTQTAANAFRVGGLTGVTTAEGNYVLTVLGTGVVSSTGLAGVGSRSITWTMDVTGPQVSSAVGLSTGLTNQLVDTFDVTFSESLAAGSFTAGDVRLTRGSQSVSTAGLMVTALASDRYRVTGLSAITQLDGSYRLSIAGSDVADAAANSGAGQFVRDWQLDRTVPAAATGLGVSPDTGVVGDRVTNVLAVRVTGNVAESPVSVAIYDDTTDSLLGTQQTNSGAFDIAVMFDGVGNQELRIVTTDAAGNSAAASYVVYIDQTPAFVASWGNIPSEPGAVRPDFIDMVLTEAVAETTLDPAALSLTRNGGPNLLPASPTISKLNDHTFRVSGLAGLVGIDGVYRLSFDERGLHDLADNAGLATEFVEWEYVAPPPPAELRGTLWHDTNENKVRDSGESVLANWTVFLDGNRNGALDPGELTTTTDTNGAYAFTGLPAGTYVVSQILPEDWKQTFPGTSSTLGGSFGTTDSATVIDDFTDGATGGSGDDYTWADADPATADVIEIGYDFRDLNGYSNEITGQQRILAELALASWTSASGRTVKFVRDTTSPADRIITIGSGDLAAVGYHSGVKQTMGLGGGVFTQVDGRRSISAGVVWLDSSEHWDTTYANGNPSGTLDYFTVVAREIGHALGVAVTQSAPTGAVIDVAEGTSQAIYFQTHCGCGGLPENAFKYVGEVSRVSTADGQLLEGHYHPGDQGPGDKPFYTGTGAKYTWRDADLATPDVIDVLYDFRSLGGYANTISTTQVALARTVFDAWEVASNGRLNFIQDTTAPESAIITIGVGDLAALGYTSAPRGTLALGGGTFTPVAGVGGGAITAGKAWLDAVDQWDDVSGNGDPAGTYDFFTVVAHEIGHALGLGHTDFVPGEDMMDGRYSHERTGFSANDLRLIRTLYDGLPGDESGAGGGTTVSPAGTLGVHIVTVTPGQTRTGLDFGDTELIRLAVEAGGDQSVAEGGLVTLPAARYTAVAPLSQVSVTIDWGDGKTEAGVLVPINGTTRGTLTNSHRYADNGVYTVHVTISDGVLSASDSLVVTASNVAPVAGAITGLATFVRGQTVTYSVPFSDAGTGDTHTALINWGDGTTSAGVVDEQLGAGTVSGSHLYSTNGNYTVQVTLTDKDGGVTTVSKNVSVATAVLEVNPFDPTKTDLVVGGTSGADTLAFALVSGKITATLNGTALGSFSPTGRIVAFGQEGNDTISLGSTITLPAWLSGDAGNDLLTGAAGADTLIGGAGNDSLTGGAGNDVYLFAADSATGVDTVTDSAGVDTLDFSATTTQSITLNLGLTTSQVVNANLTLTLASATAFENVVGGAKNDVLTGNTLANTLTGGGGNDRLVGGAGNDVYAFNADTALGSDILDETGGGVDTLDFSTTLNQGVSVNLGLATAQVVNSNLTLTLGSATTFENLIGGAGNDTLTGNASANVLTGGPGNDLLTGLTGNDTYAFNAGVSLGSDTVVEVASAGTDLLNFSTTTTAGVTVDLSLTTAQVVNSNLTLTLSAGNVFENATGGALNDQLTGNALANVLTGNAGNDTLMGSDGDDTLVGGVGNDSLAGGNGNDSYTFAATSALGTDTLTETTTGGIDTLNFSTTTTQVVTLDLSRTTSQVVNANLTLVLSAGDVFENATGGSLNDVLTGNSLANVLNGGAGNDTLTGSAGDDTLVGAAGNDTLAGGDGQDVYVFTATTALGADTLIESAGAGVDTLDFSTTTTFAVAVNLASTASQVVNANLTLTLSSGDAFDNVTGGSLADTLVGNALANVLTGGAGNDALTGGADDDVYVFAATSALGVDTVTELANGGVDTLDFSLATTALNVNLSSIAAQVVNGFATVSLSGGDVIDNVTGGSGNDILVGNTLANTLAGGLGNDTLTGAGGDDLLIGGAGNDLYLFDADLVLGSDTLDESAGGVDTLDFSATSTQAVAVNLEVATQQMVNANLRLTLGSPTTFENVIGGDLNDTLTGNANANTLTGNGGDDVLTGRAGNDSLIGGAGNDRYTFAADLALGTDTLNETGGGIDTLDFSGTVSTAVTINLATATAQVANANLSVNLGSATNFENVIGGALGDTITGNALANDLNGGDGNDVLTGAAGDDVLTGGLGDDTFKFTANAALGSDTVVEVAGQGNDLLDFSTTTTQSITLDLASSVPQVLNANLTLRLSAGDSFETVVGTTLNDTILGNSLNNVLFGGAGLDTLFGFGGRDLLFGGTGVDTLDGGDDDDIVVGGITTYYNESTKVLDRSAIGAIVAEWARSDIDYDTRVANLRSGVGAGGTFKLTGLTLLTDGTANDSLRGGAGRDWFWKFGGDVLNDAVVGELAN